MIFGQLDQWIGGKIMENRWKPRSCVTGAANFATRVGILPTNVLLM